MAVISLRIDLGEERRFGPGKARLLELIRDTGSISAAGRALGMSYRRAWLLTDELNQLFGQRLVEPQHGGAKGGGAQLTEAGAKALEAYRRIEAAAELALVKEKAWFGGKRTGSRKASAKRS
jgi:molybdate transport system regulatory protein